MEIANYLNFTYKKNINSHFNQPNCNMSYPNLAPLKQDSISFCALKKSDFKGIDRAIIEMFKINPQQLKTKEDLQEIAKQKVDELKEKDYSGRLEETKIQRKAMLSEWFNYVIKENDAYSNTQQLLILSSVVKDLKENNDNIPPVLNKGVLADCIYELESRLKENPNGKFDFNKMYQNKLRESFLEDFSTGETMTGWVKIPSKKNDPDNFEHNVEKLKTLSHKSWCTKSYNARPYLAKGDFHVYLENGQPKLGVRFCGDVVEEIQGEKNDSKIPVKYIDEFKIHMQNENLKLSDKANEEIKEAENRKLAVEKIKKDLGISVELKTIDDALKVLNCFGLEAEKNEDGTGIVISSYKQPDGFSFEDVGVNEIKLFKFVTKIKNSANFRHSQITNLGNLKSIGGDADFRGSKVTSIGNLELIGGCANFDGSQITDLGILKLIGGDAHFEGSQIINLGNLETIGGSANFKNSQIANFGNLKSIGGDVSFEDSQATSLGNLELIGGAADFRHSKIINLGNLETIGGSANFSGSKITNLGNLKSIGGDADFSYSQIIEFENLETIGGSVDFRHSKIINLGNLETIGGGVNFNNSKIINLGNLKSIGGAADFRRSKVINLGNLEMIAGDAFFERSEIISLGNLETIGGDANFRGSEIINLGNLKSIGGDAQFGGSKITELGNLESIGRGITDFGYSQITSLGNLKTIGGRVNFNNSKIINLGNLKSIGGAADFRDSQITSLENLETIGAGANFFGSQITSLGNLRIINGYICIENSKLSDNDFANIQYAGKRMLPWV